MNKKDILTFFATLGPVGYSPMAPGTAGTVVSAVIVYLLRPSDVAIGVGCFFLFFLGVMASTRAEQTLGESDSSHIVVDEAVAFPIALLFNDINMLTVIMAFFLFRFFDIVKPFPIKKIEAKLHRGLAVMTDDLVAAIYSNITLHIVLYLINLFRAN